MHLILLMSVDDTGLTLQKTLFLGVLQKSDVAAQSRARVRELGCARHTVPRHYGFWLRERHDLLCKHTVKDLAQVVGNVSVVTTTTSPPLH